MTERPLRIAVVGHTNTGKTSLIRTLTRDRQFGEVADRGGTTRRITSVELRVKRRALIELFDSPGLEHAALLIEWLERQPVARHDGPARVRCLLDDPQACARFDQEARVLELMQVVDIGLYVIDTREPVLEKYQDELAILSWCARPLVAVFNFVACAASRQGEWHKALAAIGLHTRVAFDATVRDPESERRLFKRMASQLEGFDRQLAAWVEARAKEQVERLQAASRAIAALVLDAAAARRRVASADPAALERVSQALRKSVRDREQACVETLLDLYRFGAEDYLDDDLPIAQGRWQDDLFDPETLVRYGLQTTRYAGAGAGAGAVVDLATGGMSLGGGILIGALLGAGAGLGRGLGGRLADRLTGRSTIAIDEATLWLLLHRQLHLLASLRWRGHASQVPVRAAGGAPDRSPRLPKPVRQARARPAWSQLNKGARPDGRSAALNALGAWITRRIEAQAAGSTGTR